MANIVLSSAGKIFSIGQAIKRAVATDRRNKKEFRGIVTCVDRVYSILGCVREKTHLIQHPVMNDTLDDLANSLEEALDLINDCQGRNAITRLLKAGETAKELRRVKDDIDQKLLVGIFAGMVQIFTLTATIQDPQDRRNITQISVITSLQEWGKRIDPRKLVVVHFSAGWCRASRKISPVFADLAKKFRNVVFLEVNVDVYEMESVLTAFSVNGVPTFVFMKWGYVKDRVIGADKEVLEEVLEEQAVVSGFA
ncbi:unnamed protein product [Urochloa humidicola]